MPRLMLSDDQYERIASLLPGKITDPGRTAADSRARATPRGCRRPGRRSGVPTRPTIRTRSCNIWKRRAFRPSFPVAQIVLNNALWTSISMPHAIWSNASSVVSSNSVASPPATKSSPNDSHHSLRSPLHSSGSADCQQTLVHTSGLLSLSRHGNESVEVECISKHGDGHIDNVA